MDLRLVVPAAAIWLGTAFTFIVTNGPVAERSERSGAVLILCLVLLALALVIVVLSVTFHWQVSSRGVTIIVGISGFILGLASTSMQVNAQSAQPLARWIDVKQQVSVLGVIQGEPRVRGTGAGAVWKTPKVRELSIASTWISDSTGVYGVEVPLTVEIDMEIDIPSPGTHVRVFGSVGESRRYGNFAAALNNVESIETIAPPGAIDHWAQSLREGLRDGLVGINPNAGSLVAGLAIGDESALPAEVKDQMRLSGLAHLTAVSGGNITILLAMVILACALVGLRLVGRVVVSLAALAFYVVLVSPQPSVLRAATMGAIVVLSLLVGGRRAGPSVLATAVIILLLFDPSLGITWGFALSVSATAGLILLTPVLISCAKQLPVIQRTPPVVVGAATLTIAAQISTLPVLIAMGVPIGLGSVPANVLAMPAVPFITIGGLLSSVASVVHLPLGHVIAVVSSWPAAWIAMLASYFSTWPTLAGGQILVTLLLLVIVGAVVQVTRRKLVLLVLPLALMAALVTRGSSTSWVQENWLLAMCDVGQGDALVLRSTGGSVIVVDTGATPDPIDQCLSDLGVTKIAAIVITHFHRDHAGGLEGVLRGREVSAIYSTGYHEPQDQYAYVESVIADLIPENSLEAGQILNFNSEIDGADSITVLWPARVINAGSVPNNSSAVLLAEIGGIKILLTGDIEREAQRAIMAAVPPVKVDIVKVPHHGSANFDPDFIDWAGGSVALFSVGADNDYGHPSSEALMAWGALKIYRTDVGGPLAIGGHMFQ